MKLISLHLKGYKYLKFNHINEIKVKFNDLIQIILGKNGSGKTRLLKQMSPLPAIPSDFSTGGFKKITITDGGVTYQLNSLFNKKVTHEFWKGDENLNPGGTISVQRELVNRIFGYNEEIHNLLHNKVTFTDMTATKRREFLQKISDRDVTFAIDIFKKVMVSLRDAQGTIKSLKVKMSKEIESLKTIGEDTKVLEERVELLQKEISLLLSEKDPNIRDHSTALLRNIDRYVDSDLKSAAEEQLALIFAANELLDKFNLSSDYEDHKKRLLLTEESLNKHRVVSDALSAEHDRMQRLIGDMDESGVEDVNELKEKIVKAGAEIDKIKQDMKDSQFTFNGSVVSILPTIGEFKEGFVEAVSELPSNEDRRFSRDRLSDVERDISRYGSILSKIDHMLNVTSEKISHIENSEESECPKCNYKWIPGVTPMKLTQLKENLVDYERQKKETAEYLKRSETERDSILEYIRAWNKFRSLFQNYPGTEMIFDYLIEDNRILSQPSQYTYVVDRWIKEIKLYHDLTVAIYNKEVIEGTLAKAQDIDSTTNKSSLYAHLENIESEIFELSGKIEQEAATVHKLHSAITLLENVTNQNDKISNMTERLNVELEKYVRSVRNEEIETVIVSHQKELTEVNERLNLKQGYQHRIDAIGGTLRSTEHQLILLKALSRALSPVDGLIAKSMGNFIDRFIDQINVVVGSIYTYPIEILSNDVDENGLTYKFPMSVNNMKDDPDDISEGSDGQKEVINFAFKLVATMFMKIDNFPLPLDEIGRAQDETHMANIMTYIKTLAADKSRQILMISHYASAHSSYRNANFIVLNKANITAPANSNEYVEFKY